MNQGSQGPPQTPGRDPDPGAVGSQRLGPSRRQEGTAGLGRLPPRLGPPAARLPARCYSNGRVQLQPGPPSPSRGARPARRGRWPLPRPATERGSDGRARWALAAAEPGPNAAPGETFGRAAEQPQGDGRGPREDTARRPRRRPSRRRAPERAPRPDGGSSEGCACPSWLGAERQPCCTT